MKLSVKNNYKNESTGIADTVTDTMTGLFNSMTQSITGNNVTISGTPGWWIDPYEPYQPQFQNRRWTDLFPFTYTGTSTGLTFSFIEFKDGKGILEVDVPGVKKDKIELTLENGLVKLEYERKGVKYTKNYSFTQKIEADLTEAQLEDGVLMVTLFEKKPEVKKIAIK